MKTGRTVLSSLACCALLVGTLAAQPTIITPTSASAPNGIAPNGIGVTPNELLFSQPYCSGEQARGIYPATALTPGSPSWTATIGSVSPIPDNACAENYFFISPGLGTFPAGSVYSTNPIDGSHDQVLKDGVVFVASVPDANPGHAGITFDQVGTFGYDLIVTTPSGITFYNSAGVLQSAMSIAPPSGGPLLETATVAPALSPGCGGCLYVTSTNPGNNGQIYTAKPGDTMLTLVATAPGASGTEAEPEGILFVPPLACTLTNTGLAYFVSAYASDGQIDNPFSTSGALLGYTPLQLKGLSGQALIPFEGDQSNPGVIFSFDPGTNTFSPFSTPVSPTGAPYQLEGASMTACTPAAGGCPATQGYWKHHAMATPTLMIGSVSYTDAELVTLLDTAPKGGDATLILVHQLIAALANEAAGAKHLGVTELGMSVDAAIADAQLLLTSKLPVGGFTGTSPSTVVYPINLNNPSSTWFVQSGTTLGGYFTTLANVLDAYNSAVGLHCSEGSGLI